MCARLSCIEMHECLCTSVHECTRSLRVKKVSWISCLRLFGHI